MNKISKIHNEMSPSHPSSNAQTAEESTGEAGFIPWSIRRANFAAQLRREFKIILSTPLPTNAKHSETNSPLSSSCHQFHCE